MSLIPQDYWRQTLEDRGGRYVRDMTKDGSGSMLEVWRFGDHAVTVPYVTDPYKADGGRYVVSWVLADILGNLPP